MMAQPFGLKDDGETPPETLLAALSAARDALAARTAQLRDIPAQALVDTFSRAELKQMAVLAESPAARPQVHAAIHARIDAVLAAVGRVSWPLLQPAQIEARQAFCKAHDCGAPPLAP
jgi:hypothetical protein